MWGADEKAIKASIRSSPPAKSSDELLKEFKGKHVPAIVDYCITGSSYRVMLLTDGRVINFGLAGVKAPRMTTRSESGETINEPEPFGLRAKYFAESRILHRNIHVELCGVDKFDTLYGIIHHPKGDVAVQLLKNGLAQITDWNMNMLEPAKAGALRQAEGEAKRGKLLIHKNYQETKLAGTRQFSGAICEVVSGDTLVVLVNGSEERRVTLSSLRAPKVTGANPQPYGEDAKEFLRKTCIGKTVQVTLEYVRASNTSADGSITYPERKMCDVVMTSRSGKTSTNLSKLIVEKGFAEVMRNKAGDDNRSQHYDELLALETAAKDAHIGMFKRGPAPKSMVADLSKNKTQAKAREFMLMQGSRQYRAIVEYVMTASRVKIFIPSERIRIMMNLNGIRCPSPPLGQKAGEAFGLQSRNYTKYIMLQREVEIKITGMDGIGSLLGDIAIPKVTNSLVDELLKRGFARVHDYSVQSLGPVREDELYALQSEAKRADKGLWSVYQEVVEESKQEDSTSIVGLQIPAKVSDIANASKFYLHLQDQESMAQLASVEERMSTFDGETAAPVVAPKRGQMTAYLNKSGSWRRARVLSTTPTPKGTECSLQLVDYGSVVKAFDSELRQCDYRDRPCCVEATIAFVKLPPIDEEVGVECAELLTDLVWERDVLVKVHKMDRSSGLLTVTINDPSKPDSESLTEELLLEGLGKVDKKIRIAHQRAALPNDELEIVDALIAAETIAKRKRKGVFTYGDIQSESDDDDFMPRTRK
eukprot:TRINITY_DN233_c0_g2_i1.p1 TRINITY_DN233_c0_g2~~TRINITY_DN233_c0_g2_i1.p1  ORF type:complete len:881 (-),score=353.25 TRINITY_DN233_c0_g2_i1:190-2472(-)